jgi:hypothetical protein
MQNKSAEEVAKILSDPTWTKVVFFRDPAKRFALSLSLSLFPLLTRTSDSSLPTFIWSRHPTLSNDTKLFFSKETKAPLGKTSIKVPYLE